MRRRIGNRLDTTRSLDPRARVQEAITQGRVSGISLTRAQRIGVIPTHVDGRRVRVDAKRTDLRSARAAVIEAKAHARALKTYAS